jgi:hypothetical protein
MYYPEFLTELNLYTNGGEYVITSTGEGYVGYYWKTFDGKYYTGKNPRQTPNQLLSPVQKTISQNDGDSFIQPTPGYPKNNLNQKVAPNPKPSINNPTSSDYENGFFYRYFSKPINANKYIEIDSNTYNLLVNQNPNINYTLNDSVKIKWVLSGFSQEEVYKQNKTLVEYTELNSKFNYLGQFLRFNYTKFYQA